MSLAKPARTVWIGLSPGTLAPARGEALEGELRGELSSYGSLHLVDAAGFPLDDRPLAADAAAMGRLLDEGIDLLLNLEHGAAIKRFDQAIDLFESRLTALRDHELLHDTLIAKAEAQHQSKQLETAKETLKRLAVLRPRKPPSAERQRPAFVKLWKDAVENVGQPGLLEVKSDPPAAEIQIDGEPVGTAPLTSKPLGPGKHYLVARWPSFTVTKAVQLSANRTMDVDVRREGPSIRYRDQLFEIIARRRGPGEAAEAAHKIMQIAGADELLIAAVRKGPAGLALYVARHGEDGLPVTVGRAPLVEADMSVSVRRLLAGMFADGRTRDFEILPAGSAQDASGLAAAMYSGRAADGTDLDAEPDPEREELASDTQTATRTAFVLPALEPHEEQTDPGITSEWWFWTLLAAGAAGAAAGTWLALRPGPPSTTIEIDLPTR